MILTSKSETAPNRISYESEFTAILHENGIVELVWNKNIPLITIDTLKRVKDSLLHFGQGKRMPVYVSTFEFMETSDEAKRYAGTREAQLYTLANAVQVDNLAKKLMYNFFLKFYGAATPARAFSDRESAFAWLISLK